MTLGVVKAVTRTHISKLSIVEWVFPLLKGKLQLTRVSLSEATTSELSSQFHPGLRKGTFFQIINENYVNCEILSLLVNHQIPYLFHCISEIRVHLQMIALGIFNSCSWIPMCPNHFSPGT